MGMNCASTLKAGHSIPTQPELGRFISRDPIGFNGGLNLFNGAGASPVTFVDPAGLSLYLYGQNYVANEFMYLLEEATGLDLSLGADRQLRIDGEKGGGSEAARSYLREVIESDTCTKIRTLEQERGNYNPNFGLFASPDARGGMHEMYLRPMRLAKAQAGAPYAYGSVIHEVTEAYYGAQNGIGDSGYPSAHRYGNVAESRVLRDFGILPLGLDTNTYMENGKIIKLSRKGGWNKGARPPHVHVKSIQKECKWP